MAIDQRRRIPFVRWDPSSARPAHFALDPEWASAMRTKPSPRSPKPVPGDTATSAFSTRSLENSTLPSVLNGSGIGDQAFYMSNAAYGRRGNVGVEVVEFNSKDLEIELLKEAVARLP